MGEKTERIVRNSLKDMNVWFQKLQNIHATTTPADFLILTEQYRYLIEVKEVKIYKGYLSFSFDRLTQEQDLIYFNKKFNNNRSVVILNFLDRTLKKSHIYFISIDRYLLMKKDIGKKSINIDQMDYYFNGFKIDILPGSKLDLKKFII
jgi:hypothetical protein